MMYDTSFCGYVESISDVTFSFEGQTKMLKARWKS